MTLDHSDITTYIQEMYEQGCIDRELWYQRGFFKPRYPVPATMQNAATAMYVQYASAELHWFRLWPSLHDIVTYARIWFGE
jgi:hypothetical protein